MRINDGQPIANVLLVSHQQIVHVKYLFKTLLYKVLL